MMKRISGKQLDEIELEIIECDCGFHVGLDATYLEQVNEIKIACPSCGKVIDTSDVCPA